MEKLLRWSDRIASLGGTLSGIGICLGVLLVTAENRDAHLFFRKPSTSPRSIRGTS